MVGETVPIKTDERINIDANWEEFKRLLTETKRDGLERFLTLLEKTDFKEAPASHKFHLSVKGGLCQHSLTTYKYAHELNTMVQTELSAESLTISALLHDLCKINYYIIGEEWDKEYKDKTNNWRKREVYKIEDKFPIGHGEKSLAIALGYGVRLLAEESLAIRHHMGFSDPSSATFAFRQAFNESALVKVIAMADQLSVVWEDHVWQKKSEV